MTKTVMKNTLQGTSYSGTKPPYEKVDGKSNKILADKLDTTKTLNQINNNNRTPRKVHQKKNRPKTKSLLQKKCPWTMGNVMILIML